MVDSQHRINTTYSIRFEINGKDMGGPMGIIDKTISPSLKRNPCLERVQCSPAKNSINLKVRLTEKAFEEYGPDNIEDAIRDFDGEIIAMNILGGGAFDVTQTYQYLHSINAIKSCTIGASSEKHLREIGNVFSD